MDKVKVFEGLLNNFETDEIRDYCADMIKEIPDYIFTIPSSTSLKFHNKTQCQSHGQIFSYFNVCRSNELCSWIRVCNRKDQ